MAESRSSEDSAATNSETSAEPGPSSPETPPEPDQAWKALSLVNDWVRHAETKVGATLAATGVVAVMLYNLVKALSKPGLTLSVFAVLCALCVVSAGCSATLALIPRVAAVSRFQQWRAGRKAPRLALDEPKATREDPVNLLFFSSIAKAYETDAPSYVEVLRSLTIDREQMTRQIAQQVHANAIVAHRKFIWADRAVKFLICALITLGAVAIIVGSRS